ncbi:hypothetical protein [Glaciihabitans sp. UYNi722]|uniref:hypothetical protein n=1 Tax=Glaciihabitans sp. UYNi722 TaxID=3156344 RepID=UPI0033940D29
MTNTTIEIALEAELLELEMEKATQQATSSIFQHWQKMQARPSASEFFRLIHERQGSRVGREERDTNGQEPMELIFDAVYRAKGISRRQILKQYEESGVDKEVLSEELTSLTAEGWFGTQAVSEDGVSELHYFDNEEFRLRQQ